MGGFTDPFSCRNTVHLVAELLVVVVVELLPDLLVEELPTERERVLENPQNDVRAVCFQSLTNGLVVVLARINVRAVQEVVEDALVLSETCGAKGRVADLHIWSSIHELHLDVLLSRQCRGVHQLRVRGIIKEELLQHLKLSVACCNLTKFGKFGIVRGDWSLVRNKVIKDRDTSLLYGFYDQIRGDVSTRVLHEMPNKLLVFCLCGTVEGPVDLDVGVRTREDRVELIDAVVVSQPQELLGACLGLNLAKERILPGSTVETAEAYSRFRIVLGDEITNKLHLLSPKTKIRRVRQSIFVVSCHGRSGQ
jgi:hypothetical protein